MAVTLAPSDFKEEFPTLPDAVIQGYIEEVIGIASIYNPKLTIDSYKVPAGITMIIKRAVRGQLNASIESKSGPAVQSLTAGGLSVRLDKDAGTSIFGDVFTKEQIAALTASRGNPQQTLGAIWAW